VSVRLEPIRRASEPVISSRIIAAASQGMSSEPVNATPRRDLEPDSPRTLGLRVELADVGGEVEELPPLGGVVCEVGGGDDEEEVEGDGLGLGQLVRSVVASSEKYTWSTGRPSLIR
jgi:hypothetical protein